MTWIVVVAALLLVAGSVVYFEKALRRSPFSLPSPSSGDLPAGNSEAECQPATAHPPALSEVALISSALPRRESGPRPG